MFVSREKNLGLALSGGEVKVLVLNNPDKPEKLKDFDIVVTNKAVTSDKMVIDSPGEYEVKGVLINTNSNEIDKSEIHYCEVIIENITYLYCFENFKFNDESYSEIEDVDVLIIDSATEGIDLQKLVNRFDPEIFVLTGSTEQANKALSDNGIGGANMEKKLKLKADDFGNEDFVLKTFILE